MNFRRRTADSSVCRFRRKMTVFTSKTLAFLAENRARNDRVWFAEHKGDYQRYVLAPLTELSEALTPAVSAIDPQIVTDPRVDKTISRIFCDMRYSKDKLLYRENMWLTFKRDKHEFPGYPEFFVVFSPAEFFYGCGYYSAGADVMDTVRGLILERHPAFLAAQEAYGASGMTLEGDTFKRSRYPEQDEMYREWLDRKTICFMKKTNDLSELFAVNLAGTLSAAFTQMKPVYDFFVFAQRQTRSKKQ